MMRCKELAELLIDYLAGDLPAEKAAHIKEHLDGCGPCVRFVETYQVTVKVTHRLPPVPMPPEMMQRLRAAVEGACREGESA